MSVTSQSFKDPATVQDFLCFTGKAFVTSVVMSDAGKGLYFLGNAPLLRHPLFAASFKTHRPIWTETRAMKGRRICKIPTRLSPEDTLWKRCHLSCPHRARHLITAIMPSPARYRLVEPHRYQFKSSRLMFRVVTTNRTFPN